MKKSTLLVLIAASSTLTACGSDQAPSASSMPNMPAAQQPAGGQAAENRGMGVVQSVDAANGSLTIAHEPIAGLGWPAMTMSFKVDQASLLEGVEVGEHIEFTLRGRDMSAVVTSIKKAE